MAPDYAQALQPLTSSNGAHREHTSTKILKDLVRAALARLEEQTRFAGIPEGTEA